jgi:hypothetical protein
LVGASFQFIEILKYSCGLRPTKRLRSDGESRYAGKLGSAATLNQNPILETASILFKGRADQDLTQNIKLIVAFFNQSAKSSRLC